MLTSTACTPAGRMLAGGGLAAAGVGVTSAALDSMTECRRGELSCPRRYSPTSPTVAMPVAAAGLGIAFLGAVVLSQHGERRARVPNKATERPTPPIVVAPPPPVLDETSAVGMAVARLSIIGIRLHQKPTTLLSVDDTQVSLQVGGKRAELSNLRVLTTSSPEWRSVRACYELREQWHLVRIGTGPGCLR